MIHLIQEASIGLWVAIYFVVFAIWLSAIKNPVEKRMKKEIEEKQTTKSGGVLVLLNVIIIAMILPLTFLVIIYKLLSVGIQQEVSFLLFIGLSIALSVITGFFHLLLKNLNPNGEAPFILIFSIFLIRLPFTMLKGIISWLFFAKFVGIWVENIFIVMVVAFILHCLYQKIEDALTGKNKKETSDK